MKRYRSVVRFAFAVLLIAGLANAGSKSKVISANQARELVRAALPSWALKRPPVSIGDGSNAYLPNFYSFSAYGPTNPVGSSTIGHFLVDLKTGDVWDGVVCQEYRSPALTKLQISIRKQLKLSEAGYRRLRHPSPYCDDSK
jgi:hypothetical protein